MAARKERRMVDAIDDLAAEIRLGNKIAALRMGASALDEADEKKAANGTTRARVERMNRLRVDIKEGLGLG